MQRIIQHCGTEVQQEMLRFPKLHENIIEVVTQLLRRRLPPTNSMVENLVSIELSYINTKHPDFHDAQLVGALIKNSLQEQAENLHKKPAQRALHPNGEPPQPAVTNNPSSDRNKQQQAKDAAASNLISNLMKGNSGKISELVNGMDGVTVSGGETVSNSAATSAPSAPFTASGSREDSDFNLSSAARIQSPMKPVNLLPEVPMSTTMSRRLSPREQRDCEVIERLIKSYFLIIRKNIQDTVPKAIMHFLVNYVKDNLQSELVTHLYKHDHFTDLLSESEHIAVRRREASEMLKALQKASLIISEIRETHMW
jgi:dynamin 1-like protein